MMLSDHFSLAEFTKSQTAIRKGIKNDPNDAAISWNSALRAMACIGSALMEPCEIRSKSK